MERSQYIKIALILIALPGTLAMLRFGYNIVSYDPAARMEESFPAIGLETESRAPLSVASPESDSFYSLSSLIIVSLDEDSFASLVESIRRASRDQGIMILQQTEKHADLHSAQFYIHASSEAADSLLSKLRQHSVIRFEEQRTDRSADYRASQARLQGLEQTRRRIEINPTQFKLSSTEDLGEQQARAVTDLARFEEARSRPPGLGLSIVLVEQSLLDANTVGNMAIEAIWWSIALGGVVTLLSIFGFLLLTLFKGGRELLAWISGKLDLKEPRTGP